MSKRQPKDALDQPEPWEDATARRVCSKWKIFPKQVTRLVLMFETWVEGRRWLKPVDLPNTPPSQPTTEVTLGERCVNPLDVSRSLLGGGFMCMIDLPG